MENTGKPDVNTEKIVIGNTTYIVSSNAENVPKDFVKKKVKKLLFDALTQKI